jgi:hypothetical protein
VAAERKRNSWCVHHNISRIFTGWRPDARSISSKRSGLLPRIQATGAMTTS